MNLFDETASLKTCNFYCWVSHSITKNVLYISISTYYTIHMYRDATTCNHSHQTRVKVGPVKASHMQFICFFFTLFNQKSGRSYSVVPFENVRALLKMRGAIKIR